MANPYYVAPLGGMQGVQQIQQGMQGIAQVAQQNKQQEQQQRIQAEAQRLMSEGTPQEIAAFSAAHPEIGQAMQGGIKFANQATEQNLQDSMQRIVAGEDPARVLQDRIATVEANGGDATQSRNELQVLNQMGPDAYRKMVGNIYAMRYGTEGVPGMGGAGKPAGIREHEALVQAAKSEDPLVSQAAKISLGLESRKSLSAQERIALDKELGSQVASQAQAEAGATEKGKLEAQLELAPKVREAIKVAEEKAKGRGEAEVSLARAKAALPKLEEVVNNLASLSDVATYTTAGKIRDAVFKEFGFGATEGATARAQIISTVDNTVLPLLRDTFGAAFTKEEGETLKRTLVDPNASPAVKRAQLNAFLQNKLAEIETGQRRVDMFSLDSPIVENKSEQSGIMNMGIDQLNSLNPSQMSEQELQQAADRYDQLQGGQ